MHGREEGEERRNRRYNRHMWPADISVAPVAPDGSSSSSASSSPNVFCKNGRKITVGDCALFKPPQDSPPFIGVIRRVTVGKDDNLTLEVNWLYRPADVTLGKGILLEAAPNEIFYSFHRDETPAESLLHPCKVAFLPKGVELPSGISCYVCRRVYDIKTKRLGWLTDRDYLNVQQEEVDQLLYKTRIEMHATVQTGGRSPKPMNGPTPTSQLKPGSDSVQNSTSSFASQNKGKKRERGDQGSDPVKRERLSRNDDVDPGHFRSENFLKSEIAKFTVKGSLVDFEGVEKLVVLMRPDRNEKQVDLACRSVLARVIAATEKMDCLSQFVHLRGLLVLDEWLQEIHKGKIGDGGGMKETDKSVEEFLLILLRALDKLPVNLQALQMCNIGKSVNHLRTHKNLEIQRKARSLVDTWKTGVEAEMNIKDDSRSGSNQAVAWRNRLSEVSQAGSRHSGGTSETMLKSSVSQVSASKTASEKLVQGETVKSAVMSPGTMKSSAPSPVCINLKDGQARGAIASLSDHPLIASRVEKSTSSSHSHNNSQCCSSDQAKTGGISGKEDARSSTAVSNKISGRTTRHRKSVNGVAGSCASGAIKEAGTNRMLSSQRNVSAEKVSHTGWTSDRAVDAPAEGTGHKLIVKIPNRICSPAQNASGGSLEDHSVMNSRASSPVIAERPDRSVKEKAGRNISSDVNTESWQSNDVKDVLTGSDEGEGSPTAIQDEYRSGENIKKLSVVAKVAASSHGNDLNPEKRHEASLSSINALIDSCAKYSAPLGDDVGMNLLASVATGEITSSDWISPANSPPGNTCVVEHSCTGHDSLMKSSPQDGILQDGYDDKEATFGKLDSKKADDNARFVLSERKPAEECEKNFHSGDTESQQASELHASKRNDVPQVAARAPASPVNTAEDAMNREGNKHSQGVVFSGVGVVETEAKRKGTSTHLLTSDTISDSKAKQEVPELSSGAREDKANDDAMTETEKKPAAVMLTGETIVVLGLGDGAALKPEKGKQTCQNHVDQSKQESDDASLPPGFQTEVVISSEITQCKVECVEMNLESKKEVSVEHSDAKAGVCQMGKNDAEECEPDASAVSAVGKMEKSLKMNFDLNEGISCDDGRCGEIVMNLPVAASSLTGISPFPASGPTSLPSSITVAAAAKGPFRPPEDLLKSKGELGWKGSAATSAFRPAEPRKVLEFLSCSTNVPHPEVTIGKKSRPPLDFDLNAPGDRVLEDFASRNSVQEAAMNTHDEMSSSGPSRSGGGLDLDLNQADDTNEIGSFSAMNSQRLVDVTYQQNKILPGRLRNGSGVVSLRDFDLNDGPLVDDAGADPSTSGQRQQQQHVRRSSMLLPQQPLTSSLPRGSSFAELGNVSNWFPLVRSAYHHPVPSPSLSEREQQCFPRMLAPPPPPSGSGGGSIFSADVVRGKVLSSPAMPFAAGSTFQYHPVLPFGTSFPLPSGSSATYVDPSSGGRLYFPPVNSQQQLLGPPSLYHHHPRPSYVVNLSDGSSNNDRKGGVRQGGGGLDLNAGPGLGGGPSLPDVVEVVRGDELMMMMTPLRQSQLSVPSSQAIIATEEQARFYHHQVSSGGMILKRKEPPEGGGGGGCWDSYKQQSSWQS